MIKNLATQSLLATSILLSGIATAYSGDSTFNQEYTQCPEYTMPCNTVCCDADCSSESGWSTTSEAIDDIIGTFEVYGETDISSIQNGIFCDSAFAEGKEGRIAKALAMLKSEGKRREVSRIKSMLKSLIKTYDFALTHQDSSLYEEWLRTVLNILELMLHNEHDQCEKERQEYRAAELRSQLIQEIYQSQN